MDRTAAERMRRYRARLREAAPQRPAEACPSNGLQNRTATERTIAALRREDRLEEVDAALIAIARTTADALDAASTPQAVSIVARVHIEALRGLLAGPEPADDELDAFLRGLREVG